MRTPKIDDLSKLLACIIGLVAMFTMLVAPKAIAQELLGDTLYIQKESPFAKSGINNRAALLFNFGSSGKGNFEFRCTDNTFLHFINPLGTAEAKALRLGEPNSDVSVRIAIDGAISEIVAQVSPTGASITGKPLAPLSLTMIFSDGGSDFAFSIAGRGGEVITDNFRIGEEDKIAFRRVAENCDIYSSRKIYGDT